MTERLILLLALSLLLFPGISSAAQSSSYPGFAEPRQAFSLDSRHVSFQDQDEELTLSVSASDFAVYRYGYVSYDGSGWVRFELSGNTLGGDWLNGSVYANIQLNTSDFGLAESKMSANRNFVVIYSCSRAADAWDCHGGWQIWQFNASMSAPHPLQDIQIVGVSASSNQAGFTPEKTLDGVFDDVASTWSAEGDGNWISYQLSGIANLSYVRFAFAYDSIRTFDVQVSNDSSSWTDVLTEVDSAGAMADQFERFEFPHQVAARYVRFVGHGSNLSGRDGWNAITETDINGFAANLTGSQCVPDALSDTCYGLCSQQVNNCGDTVDCGSCGGGITSEDIHVLYYNNFEQDSLGTYTAENRQNDWDQIYRNPGEDIYRNDADSQNPTNVYRFFFPEGTVSLNNDNGFRMWKYFSGRDELYLSYKVKFSDGFDAVLGGKLPRLEAGTQGPQAGGAGTCPDGTDWYTGGMMFHKSGSGTGVSPGFYLYYPDMWNSDYYRDEFMRVVGRYPTSCQDVIDNYGPVYGDGFDWQQDLRPGCWYTVTERVVANTPGVHNGFVEGFVDGNMVIQQGGFNFRSISSLKFDGLDFVGFFGGSGDQFASTKDQYVYYDDVIIYYYDPSSGEPIGSLSLQGRMLPDIPYPSQSVLSG